MSKIVNKERMIEMKKEEKYYQIGSRFVEKLLRLIATVNLYTSEYLLIN